MALSRLCRKAEVDDVPILNDVFLAFKANLAMVPAGGHRASADQGVVGNNLCPDEAALDVCMDLAGGVLSRRSTRN